jgi:ubiquinone/menaquinone biosynthesis C-methylase UbiE
MTQREAITLLDNPLLRNLRPGSQPSSIPEPFSVQKPSAPLTSAHWADLGAGSGTFTQALSSFVPAGSIIDAIDLKPSIARQTTADNVRIQPLTADITAINFRPHQLDGILMANALHYVADQPALLRNLHSALKPGGALILIEYDTDISVSRWVPYPLSFATASRLIAPPAWKPLHRGNQHGSVFGRANLYCAFTIAEK